MQSANNRNSWRHNMPIRWKTPQKITDKATGKNLTTHILQRKLELHWYERKLYFVGQFVTLHKCSLRFMGHNVFYAKEKVEHYPPLQYTGLPSLHILQAKWAMFSVAGRAEGRTAARNPSSAGMQYHLSKYLDNWIWEGSRSRHCNQWHCQLCHWEPASSCTTRSQTERGKD